jgi:hypothetical protein
METSNLVDQYIDCCIINGSHYDISLATVEILKNKYKYVGNNIWLYLTDTCEWITDDKQNQLKNDIKTKVCNAFIQRSLYWNTKASEETNDINLSIDFKFRSSKLLTICSKLKDDKYILTIIKESKSFFNDQ